MFIIVRKDEKINEREAGVGRVLKNLGRGTSSQPSGHRHFLIVKKMNENDPWFASLSGLTIKKHNLCSLNGLSNSIF